MVLFLVTKVWCLVGLPGSGKSYLARKIAEDCKNPHMLNAPFYKGLLPDEVSRQSPPFDGTRTRIPFSNSIKYSRP